VARNLKIDSKSQQPNSTATFDSRFSLWLDLVNRLEMTCDRGADQWAYEAFQDQIYEEKRRIELEICESIPTNAREALCLLEIVRRDDEDMPDHVIRSIRGTQSWLAQHVIIDFQEENLSEAQLINNKVFRFVTDEYARDRARD
jgi:hypothetical protein